MRIFLLLFFVSVQSCIADEQICVGAAIQSVVAFRHKEAKKQIPLLKKEEDLLKAAVVDLGNKYGYYKATSTYDAFSTVSSGCMKNFF